MKSVKYLALLVPLMLMLSGCDQVLELVNKQKANGKAVGASCRHSGRSLEDCYRRNPKVAKADIYAGWKEMNEYMQAKKITEVAPPPDVKTGSLSPIAEIDLEGKASAANEASAPAAEKAGKH
ncbi:MULTISPECIES: hypothetical protein [Deefgea]|uniref:Lipoprotein n=1 Tax=Deefgea chitinilytica TaxID=570276 RepID=A0ABS2CB14_9NEIS|nr:MULTISPECIES: hypothetical protein [Deefgea]MBM5571339.1 hypothetical protein [Deefgea chitinilytica]MBM9888572.1 hypothetical protein [Deefgea sp. CFH1-16]